MAHPSPASPSSWRDVYTLVQDVEQRLTKRMDEIAGTAGTVANDHEVRIRVLERTDDRSAVRNQTVIAGISGVRAVLLVGFAMMGALVAAANLLAILASGR